MAGAFLAGDFVADFLAGDFVADFLPGAFLADFLAGDFVAAFLAGAFVAGAFFIVTFVPALGSLRIALSTVCSAFFSSDGRSLILGQFSVTTPP